MYLDAALAKQSQISPMSVVYHDLLLYAVWFVFLFCLLICPLKVLQAERSNCANDEHDFVQVSRRVFGV